jgi:hypothetical protein
VKEFFERYDIIEVRGMDRRVAEDARQLIWDQGVDPKDAVHLATALRYHIPIFDTFDKFLIKLDGKLGKPPLRIGKPDIAHQISMFVGTGRKVGRRRKISLFRKFEPITYRENIVFRKFGPPS